MSLRAFGKSGFVAPPFVEVRPMAHDPEGTGRRPDAPHHASGAGTLTQSGCSKATACGVHRPPRPHPVTGKGGVEKLRPRRRTSTETSWSRSKSTGRLKIIEAEVTR